MRIPMIKILSILSSLCITLSQVIDVDVFIDNDKSMKTLSVDIKQDNIAEKVLLFVNEYGISSGGGCRQDENCVANKLLETIEQRTIELLSPPLSASSFSGSTLTNEGLFSGAGWHAMGNPFSPQTPLSEVEARSVRRSQKYRDYISSFDSNATVRLKQIRNRIESSLKVKTVAGSEYDCIEIEDGMSMNDLQTAHSKKRKEGVILAIGIISAPSHLAHRMAIRQTWLSTSVIQTNQVERKFFIGISYHSKQSDISMNNNPQNKSEKDEIFKPIISEALAYKDIGLLHLEDHYLSTPKKVIALFKWAVEECGAYYVLRSNDDVYIRIETTLNQLKKFPPANVMMGLIIEGKRMHVPRPETYNMTQEQLYEQHKVWTFTRSDYPSDQFPDFLQGNGFILSRDLAYEVSKYAYQPNFRLMADDIMVALILSIYYPLANKVAVKVDYEFEGLYTACSNDALWHFNIHPEHMYDLYHNEFLGRAQCDGISRFCCG